MPDRPMYVSRADVTAEERSVLDQNEAAVREWVDEGVEQVRRHIAAHGPDDPPHEVWCADRVFAGQIAGLTHNEARMVVQYCLNRIAAMEDDMEDRAMEGG